MCRARQDMLLAFNTCNCLSFPTIHLPFSPFHSFVHPVSSTLNAFSFFSFHISKYYSSFRIKLRQHVFHKAFPDSHPNQHVESWRYFPLSNDHTLICVFMIHISQQPLSPFGVVEVYPLTPGPKNRPINSAIMLETRALSLGINWCRVFFFWFVFCFLMKKQVENLNLLAFNILFCTSSCTGRNSDVQSRKWTQEQGVKLQTA